MCFSSYGQQGPQSSYGGGYGTAYGTTTGGYQNTGAYTSAYNSGAYGGVSIQLPSKTEWMLYE